MSNSKSSFHPGLAVSNIKNHVSITLKMENNVGSPVANDRLVLQLVSVLTKPYQGVATFICQYDPLPQFYQAHSILTLEEAGRAKKAAQSSFAALVARSSEGPLDVPDNSSSNRNSNDGKKNHNRRNNGGKYSDNNGGRGGGKGAANNSGNIGSGCPLGGGNSRSTGQ
ncbi:uncharacterized protein LOC129875657 [Solanum dulcamara]|uniref:uncharacterized protein LOC129875657 n=1 Tax=Solanum dulcamara TaxID=45834 RepID=UPI0024856AD4|nr:uncharacterized protein LOC129875657 [Solanum dulcamara]